MRKFHYYHQVEQTDCGVTCLRMVARWFGRKIPAKFLRARADFSRGGISVRGLKACAESVGMKGFGVKLTPEMLRKAPLPLILHWNGNHFAVLWKISRGRFYVADPAGGMLKYSEEEFREHFCGTASQGIALLLAPAEEFYKMEFPAENRGGKILEALRDSVAAHRRFYAAVIALALVGMGADLCIPLVMRRTVDEGIANADVALVWLLVIAQLGIFLGSQLTSSFSAYLVNRLGLRLSLGAVDRYLTKLVSLPLRFFDSRVNSDLIQKTYDQEAMQQFLLDTPTTMFLILLNIAVFASLLLWFNPLVFGIFAAVTVAGLAWEALMLRRRKVIEYDLRTIQGENNNNIYELVNGIADLKIHNAHPRRVSLWRKLQQKLNGLRQRSSNLRQLQGGGSSLLYRGRDLVVTGLCATLVISGDLTLGTMITVAYVSGRLSSGFSQVSASLTSLQETAVSLDRSDDVMNEPDDAEGTAVESLTGDIELSEVCFRYPGNDSRLALEDVTLSLPLGKTTAVVGPSGCGKSTLLKILQGLYRPSGGTITSGGVSLADIPAEKWGEICTSVSQNGYVFSDTIAGNIALGEETPDEEKVSEAVRMACLDPLVSKLPRGIHTRIGPSGLELSGGEKQRLLIARAIYRSTPLVLLDEATSSLDAETERHIVENLREFGKGRTMVIAAHRLSTIRTADRIVFIDGGRVVESGSPSGLTSLHGGRYASFIAGQQ